MIIPSGWIHAVVCPSRTVAGLYSLGSSIHPSTRSCLAAISSTPTVSQRVRSVSLAFYRWRKAHLANAEIRVRNIEIATSVPKKFRFPHFIKYVFLVISASTMG
jgi:hypothetical protein